MAEKTKIRSAESVEMGLKVVEKRTKDKLGLTQGLARILRQATKAAKKRGCQAVNTADVLYEMVGTPSLAGVALGALIKECSPLTDCHQREACRHILAFEVGSDDQAERISSSRYGIPLLEQELNLKSLARVAALTFSGESENVVGNMLFLLKEVRR